MRSEPRAGPPDGPVSLAARPVGVAAEPGAPPSSIPDAAPAPVRRGAAWPLLAPALGLGLLLRLWDLRQPFIDVPISNEVYYVTIARNFARFGLLAQYNYGDTREGALAGPLFGPSPLIPWMVYAASRVLGPAEWAARLPMLILGLAALIVLYLLARELVAPPVALAATYVAALMPGVAATSRQVNLDGAMTTFGLAAVLALLLFVRRRRYRWLLASALALGLALAAKDTGLLFVPCLAWIGLRAFRDRQSGRPGARWLGVAGYLVLAALPAGAWLLAGHVLGHGAAAPSAGPISSRDYLVRLDEWRLGLRPFVDAVDNTWATLPDCAGRVFWYASVAALAVLLVGGRLRALARRHVEVVLLVVPWFVQLLYPVSWSDNLPNYVYPALYGMAIGFAILGAELWEAARRHFLAGDGLATARSALVLVAGILALSCFLDYYNTFHQEFYRPDLATPADPLLSARVVRAANVAHQPILADFSNTLFYAQTVYAAQSSWYGLDDRKMVAAIEGRQFPYVVVTYTPRIDVVDALATSGYRRIAPAAWQRGDGAPNHPIDVGGTGG